jgi:hypothetical protein
MKLAYKLTIGLALGIFCVMTVNAYVRVQREVAPAHDTPRPRTTGH